MSSKFERILESKRAYRKDLARKPVAEKLRIVEELAERSLATRKDTSSSLPDQPWPIPDHWRWARMGDVATIVGGGTPRTDRSEYFGGDVPWITPADLSGYKEKTIARGARNITQAGLENSGAKLLPANAVLFSSRAPIGYVAIASNPVATNQGFKSFILRDELLPDFVYYYLQRAKDFAVALASGTTFLEISGKNAARLPIPIPPLDEQRQIVAEIEKQFSRLDEAVANLKRIKANLKRYKAAVLKAAVEGKLVETEAELARREGRNYETGEQLLKRILETRRAQWKGKGKYKEPAPPDTTDLPELPEGWAWASLDALAWDSAYGTSEKCAYENIGPAVLRIPNIQVGSLDLSDLKFAPDSYELPAHAAIATGDMLIIRTNGSKSLIGKTALPVTSCLYSKRESSFPEWERRIAIPPKVWPKPNSNPVRAVACCAICLAFDPYGR